MIGNQALVDETMRMLVDTGLSVLDVESARITADSKASDFTSLLDLSAQLGARYVAMTCRDPETERAAEVMARMAEQARELALRLALEFTRSSAVVSLSDALAVVDTVGAPDVVGVLFDFLHFSRSGGRYSDVRVDDERIFYAQMCDAPYDGPTPGSQPVPAETIAREARERLLPGDGVLPICELVQALPCKAVFSVEVPRGHDGHRSADIRAQEVYASARRVLAGG
jgi:sugar phosphate isomerase/epimerase